MPAKYSGRPRTPYTQRTTRKATDANIAAARIRAPNRPRLVSPQDSARGRVDHGRVGIGAPLSSRAPPRMTRTGTIQNAVDLEANAAPRLRPAATREGGEERAAQHQRT